MNFGIITRSDCVNVLPPPDSRCDDPAFALLNPQICSVQPRLVVKPSVALSCNLGEVQFKAFLVSGGNETDVTGKAIFSSSDLNIAMVGAKSGNATGMGPGQATITATYDGRSAGARLTVLSGNTCCDQQKVAMLVVVDLTQSMSQVFNGTYATRLDYAKAAAKRFINEVNIEKDVVGLMSFSDTTDSLIAAITNSTAATASEVDSLTATNKKTEFYDVANAAVAALNNVAADRRVIILISDGEDTLTEQFNQDNDPILALQSFKDAGGVVICLGVRAAGNGFAMLSAMATGGFFINAYPDTAQAALDYLSGVKGYICAGNCTPAGDTTVHEGVLNYTGFINWAVQNGSVDLCGNGFFDFLPGNGLYVDLAGTSPPQNGQMVLKTPIAIHSGDTYRLSLRMAGNQRSDEGDQKVRIRVYDPNIQGDLINQSVLISDYTQDFQVYSFSFTAQHDSNAVISIQQDLPNPDPRVGCLLDKVTFENTTDIITLLSDDFDSENPVYLPPACGVGSTWTWLPDLNSYGYASGYDGCYGVGCLDSPPPVQLPDPNPLPTIEDGSVTPPKTYTSTQTACAQCPDSTVQVSDVNAVPDMTDYNVPAGYVASASSEYQVIDHSFGLAWQAFEVADSGGGWMTAANNPTGWLQFKFAGVDTIAAYTIMALGTSAAPIQPNGPKAWKFQGSNDGTTWTDLDTQSNMTWFAFEKKTFVLSAPAPYTYFRLLITANYGGDLVNNVGINRLRMYYPADNPQVCKTATATSNISQSDADSKAYALALAAAQAALTCNHQYTSTQQYTATCAPGTYGLPVTQSATATSTVSQADADQKALAAAQEAAMALLACNLSNNDQKITINDKVASDPAPATPYPSVKSVTGAPASIANVSVTLKGFTHSSPADVCVLLRGPDGTTCLLMERCGGPAGGNGVSNLTLTFDDSGAVAPQNSALSSTTYKPTQYGIGFDFPTPALASPYGTTLSVFNGKNGNGSWSLWVVDINTGDAGQIANGFDVTIT